VGRLLARAGKRRKVVTRRLHIAFVAPSRAGVDEFWRAGTSAGYRDDGRPGARPQYSAGYYGAFLLDPDGNSTEAVHHGEPRRVRARPRREQRRSGQPQPLALSGLLSTGRHAEHS
jgi:hypothetical protein